MNENVEPERPQRLTAISGRTWLRVGFLLLGIAFVWLVYTVVTGGP